MNDDPAWKYLRIWWLVNTCRKSLPAKERMILDSRLRGLTTEECAKKHGMTNGRARQIESKALRHMREMLILERPGERTLAQGVILPDMRRVLEGRPQGFPEW